MSEAYPVLREPSQHDLTQSHLARYLRWLEAQGHGSFTDYAALHRWSVENIETFWKTVWDYCGLIAEQPAARVLDKRAMPGARWFEGAHLNFARNLLREALDGDPDKVAVTAVSESRGRIRLTYGELRDQAGALEAYLRALGVKPGDRVAAVVAHTPEALVGMLASASLGAVWSSASPDFGVAGIMDRFGQIEPTVLIAVNGYSYNGKHYSKLEHIGALAERMPSLRKVIVTDNLPGTGIPEGERFIGWDEALVRGGRHEPSFTTLPFDHPLYIMFSSGTTGVPKCIVHGAGGVLLQHAKELMLHGDVQRDDRLFYFTTCGWMMWNWHVSGLVTGAELILFDGSPSHPSLDVCWRLAEEVGMTHFGTSAKFLGSCRNAGLRPRDEFNLGQLRTVFSTGSPLLPEDFDWVYDAVKPDVLLASISGGTDIISCFVGGCPTLPVRRGEIQCAMLGMDVQAWSEDGRPVVGARGELVCAKPAPCMPVGFWNDPGGKRYRAAYFERFPGVWAHGDYIEFTEHGGVIIYGRSDATLNPGGVRIGTAEIYRQVETLPEIADSIVVGQRMGEDQRVVLLVVLNDGYTLDDALIDKIRKRIRENASPRHVPARIVAIDEIPYTRSGKKVELAVTRILQHEKVENREAITNPDSLDRIAAMEALFQ